MFSFIVFTALAVQSTAFPFVADVPGVRRSLLPRARAGLDKRTPDDTCPFNPDHRGAVPINSKYPYRGAINGANATGPGGIPVPAPGDTAHYFTPPGPLDIRGPCPGLNTLANHNFLSHDGITTYNELVDAQQNVYNLDWDLANLLATAGVRLDGDLVTSKLSIGCGADSRTNAASGVGGYEPGLNGHNKFEADSSLTRNDLFLANGDNYKLNTTLFGLMSSFTKNNFNRQNLGLYRQLRYNQSRETNPEFFFSPGSLLLYGAATFLYRAFPGSTGQAGLATQKSFFGVDGDTPETFTANNQERLPDGWRNVEKTYTMFSIGGELLSMYQEYPVQFGANVGQAGNFLGMDYGEYISGGFFKESSFKNMMCLIYQLVTAGFPTSLSNVYLVPVEGLSFILSKLEPGYKNLGCPSPLYPSDTPIGG